jgi:hypothetical protein
MNTTDRHVIDDGGTPNDAATRFLLDAGLDATGEPPALSADLMKRGARVSQRAADADRPGFLEWAVGQHADREPPAVVLDKLERDLDAKLARAREHVARREWIQKICAPVTSPAERQKRITNLLNLIVKTRSDDFRAILAAVAFADMLATPGISADHRINVLAVALRRSVRQARDVVKVGRALLDDLARHALPDAKAVSLSGSQKGKRVRPNIRAAVKRSLHDSAISVEAISRLSPRDQATVAAAIERHVMLAELEAREDIDTKAGLHKLPCALLDDLGFAGRDDSITRRQLAKLRPVEQRFVVRELVIDKLDHLTEAKTLAESAVAPYVGAFRAFAKSYRGASDSEIKAAKRSVRREADSTPSAPRGRRASLHARLRKKRS